MFGMGMMEMLIIAGVALVVMGPEKFPDFAKVVLRTIRDFRGYMDEAKREISKEIIPVQKELNTLSKYDPESYLNAITSEGGSEEKSKSADHTDYSPESAGLQVEEPQPGADTTGAVQDDRPEDDPYYAPPEPEETEGGADVESSGANGDTAPETPPTDPSEDSIENVDPSQGIEPPERLDG